MSTRKLKAALKYGMPLTRDTMNPPTPELVRVPQLVLDVQFASIAAVDIRREVSEKTNSLGMKCDFNKQSPTSVTSLRGGPSVPSSVISSGDYSAGLSAQHTQHVTLHSSNDPTAVSGQHHYQILRRTTKDNGSTPNIQLLPSKPGTKFRLESLAEPLMLAKSKFQFEVRCSVTRGSSDVKTTTDLRRAIRAEEEVSINGERVHVSDNTSEWTSSRIFLMHDWPYDSASDVILAVDAVTAPHSYLIRDRIRMINQQREVADLCAGEVHREIDKSATARSLIGKGRASKRPDTTRNTGFIGIDTEHRVPLEKPSHAHASTTPNAPQAPVKAKWSIKSAKAMTEDKMQSQSRPAADSLYSKASDFQSRTLERIMHHREVLRVAEVVEERRISSEPKFMKREGEDEKRTLRMNELRKKTLERLKIASAKVEEDKLRTEKSLADRLRVYSLRTGRLNSLPSMYNGVPRDNLQTLTSNRKSVSAEGALNPRYLMAQRAHGSALPPIAVTWPEPPLMLPTSIPQSPCNDFLAHTMTKYLHMPGTSAFGTERPCVSSTLVPLALTASGALAHHNPQHTADSILPLKSIHSHHRDSTDVGVETLHGMEEDSLDDASPRGMMPLDSIQYSGLGTTGEENSPLATGQYETNSLAKETSDQKISAAGAEEHNEYDDSQSELSELSSEDRSLSPNRDQPTPYNSFVNNKNKNMNKKLAPWRVLKPIVLKPFIALQPQDI